MKFGPVPVREAAGAILAHSLGLPSGRLKKGRVLSEADISALAEAGIEQVTVARPDAGDLLEDEAARRVAAAIAPDPDRQFLSVAAPFTGRANIYAEAAGVLRVDPQAVRAVNDIDEAITLATLPDLTRVAARQMIGTVKVIPYGAPLAAIERIEAVLGDRQVLGVRPFRARNAKLVLTRTPGMKDTVVAKGAEVIGNRLAALGIDDVDEAVTAHETGELAAALGDATQDLVLILTGSATSDRGDVGPAAVVRAGGRLIRFGMPVDPGNLLFLGELNGRPVIGLPGCARSPKLNGADWVLERLACGLEVNGEDVAAMGVGGLLKEIPSRPEPRAGGAVAPERPRVSAILLAAGASRRMAGRDKLLEPVNGVPLLRVLAERLIASAVDEVLCVTAPDAPARRAVLDGLALRTVVNPRAAEGMGTSISAGIGAVDPRADAALIVLGDMPEIDAADVDRLIAGFDPGEGRAIVRAATPDGRAGQPVLFGRRFFEALRALGGDMGARSIVEEHPEFVVDVVLPGTHAVRDLDTPEAWQAWRVGASSASGQ